MKFSLLENFFGIRTGARIADQIILGVLPIFFIFLLWVFATSGRTETVTLPDGIFEGYEKAAPPDGTLFKDRIRLTIENSSLEYASEIDPDQGSVLVKDGQRFKLGNMPARPFGKSVRITLPIGRIIDRVKEPPLPIEVPGKKVSESLPVAVPNASGGEPIAVPAVTDTTVASIDSTLDAVTAKAKPPLMKFNYQFEIVETRIISPSMLPSPSEVSRSLPSLWSDRFLPKNILFSFLRVSAGFLVAFSIVFPVSLMMGTFSKCKALFAPLMLFAGYLPIPALVPLFMILFGTNELQKIMFLAFGFAIYLLPLFVKALEEVDNVYLQTGYTLGAGKFQILNNILLPIALPNLYDAMRLGFGIGWGYIILAEMVDMGSFGVGTLILTSQRRGPREDIYLVLIAIVLMAFITDKIWEKVGERLFPYRSQRR
ncbi:MAG TPA: ABC transporter permease subunit [Candidatus Rifleibacterium sp.]|nr:ABC transporter permease subunit [Candidatus Rifleibacterium sp.]HPT44413.1 ABC transporter permease subunit [Candidatus Rifleibacterium sp.]